MEIPTVLLGKASSSFYQHLTTSYSPKYLKPHKAALWDLNLTRLHLIFPTQSCFNSRRTSSAVQIYKLAQYIPEENSYQRLAFSAFWVFSSAIGLSFGRLEGLWCDPNAFASLLKLRDYLFALIIESIFVIYNLLYPGRYKLIIKFASPSLWSKVILHSPARHRQLVERNHALS